LETILQEVNLTLVLPELLLAIVAGGVLAVGLMLGPGMSARPLLWASLVGVVGSGAVALRLLGQPGEAFFGAYVVDPYAVFFKVLILVAAGLVILAAFPVATRPVERAGEFFALLLLSTVGLMLLVSSTELITIYLSLELSSLSLAFLATYRKEDLKSTEAGLKYFLLSVMSSAILLYGMALLYGLTGTTRLENIAQVLSQGVSPAVLLALAMLVAGFGFKLSAVPFQMWTPDVYEGAPTPITAYLSVASKAAGVAVVLRVFQIALPQVQLSWLVVFAVLAALTMTVGNVVAIVQSNIKRMLAYSTIGHAGYILMGLAAGSPEGYTAALYYTAVYVATNLLAFAVVTAGARFAPDDGIASYAGLHRRAPALALALAFGLLSLAGLPPFAGFFGKLYLFWAAAEAGLYWLVFFGVLNSVVSLYYYAWVIRQMYLVAPTSDDPIKVPVSQAASMLVAGVGVLVLGVLASPFMLMAQEAVGVLTVVR
jgi:NADH-quinone oxidoreductase subunit N